LVEAAAQGASRNRVAGVQLAAERDDVDLDGVRSMAQGQPRRGGRIPRVVPDTDDTRVARHQLEIDRSVELRRMLRARASENEREIRGSSNGRQDQRGEDEWMKESQKNYLRLFSGGKGGLSLTAVKSRRGDEWALREGRWDTIGRVVRPS